MNNKINPLELAKFAALGIAGFLVYKIFRGTGLIKSQEEQKEEQKIKDVETGTFEPLNPKFWQDLRVKNPNYKIRIIKETTVRKFIDDLKSANLPLLPANKDKLFAVFNQLSTQSQFSYLADKFAQLEKKDLSNWLNVGAGRAFNDSDKIKLIKIIEKLPLGLLDKNTLKLIK